MALAFLALGAEEEGRELKGMNETLVKKGNETLFADLQSEIASYNQHCFVLLDINSTPLTT